MIRCILIILFTMISWVSYVKSAEPPNDGDLKKAVVIMRRTGDIKLPDEQKKRSKELDQAWKILINAGPSGAAVLKEEIRKLEASKEKDDLFKLGAAVVLWQIGKAKEAEAIAALWSGDVNLNANYSYVFFTAFRAAATQDARVLPMLIPILKDQKGVVFSPHNVRVDWPLSHAFIWGTFGSKGIPALERVLQESRDEVSLASAVYLLGTAQDVTVIEKIRSLARHGGKAVRIEAMKALGRFGHPQDFDFLLSGLKAKDPEELFAVAFALYEYGDIRAVPNLIPLLQREDKKLALEMIACLDHLLTPEAIEALQQCADGAGDTQRRQFCKNKMTSILPQSKLDYKQYAAKGLPERAKMAALIRDLREEKYRLKPGDRKATHDDLLKATAEWRRRHRITGGTYEWMDKRHILAAATAADIPLFLDTAAAVYPRFSDECLPEIRTLNELIQRIGRTRYRREVGVCSKVEPINALSK